MKIKEKPLSEFQLALKQFSKNKLAVLATFILFLLYISAIFADFLSPYSYKNEDRSYSYCPPTKIHFFENGKFIQPYVNGIKLNFNEYHRRIYVVDEGTKHFVKFFSRGDKYRLLGLIPNSIHLFTVSEPGRIYLLGADSRGRDIFSRLLYGGRISLSIGLIGVLISFSIGLIIGGIAGFYGGKVDNILMRLCEMIMMIPSFYLLLALRASVPDFLFNNLNFVHLHYLFSDTSVQVYFSTVIILSFIGWAGLARIIRGMCLSLKERDYVLAAKTFGLSDFQIIIKHVLPHTVSYSIFAIMLSIPGYILSESALSLIGLGIQDPYASWGNMLSDSMSIIRINFAPWIIWPALFIFLSVVCFNVLGDALRDCLDPTLKSDAKG